MDVSAAGGAAYEVYRMHMGDTQVGAVYLRGSTTPLLQNSDGEYSAVSGEATDELCDQFEAWGQK
jgi:hypothetical protein